MSGQASKYPTDPLDSLRAWMSAYYKLGPRWVVEQPVRRYYKVSLLWGLQRIETEGRDFMEAVTSALDQFQLATTRRYAEESGTLRPDLGVLGEEETLP